MSIQLHAAVILQYHQISSEAPVSTSITPERFLQHLELIETEGFRVVSLAEILSSESIEKSSSGPQAQAIFDRRVAITFDDGYSSVYTNAYPLLKRRQWPFTVFVNSGPIDTGRAGVMTWDQLREMAANGASIANHTVDHQHLLQRLIGEDITQWRDRVTVDIHQAESRILEEIGVSHRLLAYPYGEYSRELQQLLESLEYRALGQQSGPLAGIHSNQALPRFVFGGHYGSPEDFRIKLNALPFPATALTIRTRQGFKADGVVDDSDETIGLDLVLSQALDKVQCFGPVALKVEQSSTSLKVKLEGLLPVGRSRINCTVRHASGHFRWFSHPFFRPSSSGQWLE